jgi:hypothetical protein
MAKPPRTPAAADQSEVLEQTLSNYYEMTLRCIPDKVLAEALNKWIKAVNPAEDHMPPAPEWWLEDMEYERLATFLKASTCTLTILMANR